MEVVLFQWGLPHEIVDYISKLENDNFHCISCGQFKQCYIHEFCDNLTCFECSQMYCDICNEIYAICCE